MLWNSWYLHSLVLSCCLVLCYSCLQLSCIKLLIDKQPGLLKISHVNVKDTIFWLSQDRVMQLNWLHFCGICQLIPLKLWPNTVQGCNHQSTCMPSYSLYVQLLWYPMYYPGGMKARVSPVQWSKPHSILAPLRIRTQVAGFRITSGDHYTTICPYATAHALRSSDTVTCICWPNQGFVYCPTDVQCVPQSSGMHNPSRRNVSFFSLFKRPLKAYRFKSHTSSWSLSTVRSSDSAVRSSDSFLRFGCS